MKVGTARLEAFSDGVIAIVITIMILQLKLPNINKDSTAKDILKHLHYLAPYFTTYVLSFTMIGILWTNHHHMFHFLEKTDGNLVWQNFIFLFLISLIPFATYLIGASPLIPIAPAIYAFIMLLTTLCLFIMQYYSFRKKLLHKDRSKILTQKIFAVSTKGRIKSIAASLVYLVAIPLAYVNVYIAYICFIISPIIFFIPEGIDDEKLAEKVGEKNG